MLSSVASGTLAFPDVEKRREAEMSTVTHSFL